MNKDYILSKKDINKKDKLFLNMRKNINKLNNELFYFTSDEPRNKTIKNLKIYKEIVKTIIPYLLSASVTLCAFSLINIPFVRDIKREYISSNNTNYDNFILVIKGETYKDNNGNNVRDISKYIINCNLDEIKKILNEKCDITNLKLISSEVIISDKIYETEENIIFYEDYVYSLESISSNITLSILYVMLTTMIEIYSYKLITNNDNYKKLKNRINDINYDYDFPDLNLLKTKIKIYNDNYRRLMK